MAGEPQLRLRIMFGSGLVLGPGKADLLDGIATTGSISAAGRAMSMSYKKAWRLVDDLNHGFVGPLVEATAGGADGGGAGLTDLGKEVLALYRQAEREAAASASGRVAELGRLTLSRKKPGAAD
ncbi:MAG: LysR family transcriptional regulator [Bauldia sp.]